jgi:hypothetical protein|tara:strand:- start:3573 stop:3782 length:210 start_codon:yes stop_codon:yes gene_type:complete
MIEILQNYLIEAITQLQVMKAIQDEQPVIPSVIPVWEQEGTLDYILHAWDLVQFEEYRQWATQFYGVGL